jgi:hypothetical protein
MAVVKTAVAREMAAAQAVMEVEEKAIRMNRTMPTKRLCALLRQIKK